MKHQMKKQIHGAMLLLLTCLATSLGCRTEQRDDLDYSYRVLQTWEIDEIEDEVVVQFEQVFWEPDDTISLRELIKEGLVVDGRDVLEIGTGTGLLSVLSLRHDAVSVIATDINPAAVANAKYNAAMLADDRAFDVRLVPSDQPQAFSVIRDNEQFDVILSNPPWEDGQVSKPLDHAFYDPHFELMDSLLDGLPKHLKPGGRCLLAYGHRPAIERLRDACQQRGYVFKVLDERTIQELDEDFLPGMLIEVKVPMNHSAEPKGEASEGVPSEELNRVVD
jgi:release factor glutamine methyltransferase